MIKLGCCAFNFTWLDLEASMRLVRELGFRYVDLGATGPEAQVNQSRAIAEPDQMAAEIRMLADRFALSLSELFVTGLFIDGQRTPPNHPNPTLRQHYLTCFRQLCRCAAKAGFESVMGVPGLPQADLGENGSWDVAVEMLTAMVKVAQENGLNFHVEPHKDSLIEKPDLALQMARNVPGLAYTLDYAHFIGQGIPQSDIASLHAYTGHMHAKPAAPGIYKCLVHQGSNDYAALVQDLQRRNWDGVISMEYIGNAKVTTLTAHPTFQTVLLAHQLEKALGKVS